MEGKKAPAFSLLNQLGEKVRLSGFIGQWVILYFYPRDNTPGCTIEAIDFTAFSPEFSKVNAVILGVSPDTAECHAKFIEKKSLGITLLSDPEHATMDKYGAWGEKMMYGKTREGVLRSTFIIDPKGKIVKYYAKVRTKGHAEAVLNDLKEMI